MNSTDWSLREQIGEWIAHWYIFVLVFLIGGAVGWSSTFVFPVNYEARAPLYVAFNSDALFTSPDDYKNAQFEEVTDLILSDALLDEFLTDWDQDWDRDELRARLSVQWRNAGRWELVVRDRDPARAAQWATLWREIAFSRISAAIPHSLTLSQLDQEANLLSRDLAETTQAQVRIEAVQTGLRAWLETSSVLVSVEERAELWAYAQEYLTPGRFPEERADRETYRAWAEEMLSVLEIKRGLLEVENQALQTRMDVLREEWEAEKTASRGLSAYLLVELRGEVTTQAVRKPGVTTLVGGGVGVLGWIAVELVSMGRKRRKHG